MPHCLFQACQSSMGIGMYVTARLARGVKMMSTNKQTGGCFFLIRKYSKLHTSFGERNLKSI